MSKAKGQIITVGELRELLSQSQGQVPVRIHISTPGDARKKHSPWIDTFRLGWSHHDGEDVVVIYCVEVEA